MPRSVRPFIFPVSTCLLVGLALLASPLTSRADVQVIPAPTGHAHQLTIQLPPASGATAPAQVKIQADPVQGGYAVITSRQTEDDPAWSQVVKALAFKRRAPVIVYSDSVDEARSDLARQMPRYACFVVRPEEAGRAFVITVSRMTRTLNDDPYTDVIWGILTGYSPADALRIVSVSHPLVIRKAAAGTSIPLNLFDAGMWYDEGQKNHSVVKMAGGKPEEEKCPDDTTALLVNALDDFKPDLFVTSGHASERNWLIGYTYHNGQFVSKNGVLYGVDTQNHILPIHSPNPKVYTAIGNCLMGHIQNRQSMALAWMGSAGVDQMVGYVVETWYGYGGWGILDYFEKQPGRFSLAQSFYLNNQALIYRLHSLFPKNADLAPAPDSYNGQIINQLASELGYKQWNDQAKDNVGLIYDRDVVAFYGDPAWEARLAHRPLPWNQKLTRKGTTYTFEIKANEDNDPGRPPAAFLPERLKDVQIVAGQDLNPVITGNIIMVPGLTHLEKGRVYRVVFQARQS